MNQTTVNTYTTLLNDFINPVGLVFVTWMSNFFSMLSTNLLISKKNTDGRLAKATVVYAPARGQDNFSFIKLLF